MQLREQDTRQIGPSPRWDTMPLRCWLRQLSQLGASLPFLPECAAPRGPVDDHLEGEGLGTTEPNRVGQ